MRRRVESAEAQIILRTLESGKTVTFRSVAELLGITTKNAREHLKAIRDQIHVVRWELNNRGPRIPVFAFGEGEDAPYPNVKEQRALRRRVRQQKPFAILINQIRK